MHACVWVLHGIVGKTELAQSSVLFCSDASPDLYASVHIKEENLKRSLKIFILQLFYIIIYINFILTFILIRKEIFDIFFTFYTF